MTFFFPQEVDVGLGLFVVTPERAEAVDFTHPVDFMSNRMIISRGLTQVDPWAFLLPLGTFVWIGILAALLGFLSACILIPQCLQYEMFNTRCLSNATHCVRVLMQQGESCISLSYLRVRTKYRLLIDKISGTFTEEDLDP